MPLSHSSKTRSLALAAIIMSCAGGGSSPAVFSPPALAQSSQPATPESAGGMLSLADGFAAIVGRVSPAVVNISTIRMTRTGHSPFGRGGEPFFAPFFNPLDAPRERREQGLGSGVIVSSDGYILTNNHVVEGSAEIKVSLADGRDFRAKLIGTDKKTDIALIKIDAKDLPVVTMGDSTKVRVGEFAIAIGNPFGLDRTVTLGIVSAIGRGSMNIVDYEDFIQTDAAINPGNSGGALVNYKGELIGINTAIISRSQGNQGIGFAVPTHLVKATMDQLKKNGRVTRGYLGVAIQEITPALSRALGLTETRGALVGDVVDGGPAEKAGIRRGDVITELDGKPVESSRGFRLGIAQTSPGVKVRLTVFREGSRKDLVAVLDALPDDDSQASMSPGGRPSREILGLGLSPLTPDLARRLDVPPDTKGAVITEVDAGSLAEQAGLRPGDVILEVNRKPIVSPDDVEQAARNSKGSLFLLVRRGSTTSYVVLETK
ncbi:MAG: DegQ family serine endoprotease [Deltaproteobacteria bacterium]|nr:DegQ family serine endoprotease [Deltaproteobacteria bacterium]